MLARSVPWLLMLAALGLCLKECVGKQDGTITMTQDIPRPNLYPRKWDAWRKTSSSGQGKRLPPTKTWSGRDDLPFRNPKLSWEKRVDDLVGRLTLEEIVQQTMTTYTSPGTVGIPRLGIAPYPWITECLRGQVSTDATAFPQALGLSSAFSPELHFNISTAVSKEVRAHWNINVKAGVYSVFSGLTCYSPVVNIMRHPLWGRNQETYGEDPYLTGMLGAQYVRGLQGSHPRYRRTTATCKHFDAHGGPEDIPITRYDFDARVTPRDWWMTFLPQFKMCIGAGAGGAMCSYNSLNGVPACANKKLLDVARKTWNFTGYITGDAGAIQNIVTHHHYLPNNTMAAAAVLKSGCNMEIQGNTLNSTLDAVSKGLLTETQVRENVKPLFYVRMRHGEFDPADMNPYSKLDSSVIQSPDHRELAIRAAMMSFVLLKNDDSFLPIKKTYPTAAIVGPLAMDLAAQSGDYASNVNPRFAKDVYEGLHRLGAENTGVRGCSDPRCEDYNPEDIRKTVGGVDLVVVALGLGPMVESEMTDRRTIDLPGSQLDLLQDAVFWAAGNPVVLLLFTAGPIDLTWAMKTPGVKAILQCFYPAQATGEALYRTFTMKGPGPFSPAGRLTATWPAFLDQVGPITDYNMDGRTYRYYKGNPLFPFGYGLSYSRFQYTNLQVSPSTITAGQNVTVTVTLRNMGPYNADEVVQVYLSWEDASLPAPRLQLVGFRRVSTNHGQTVSVTLIVSSHQMALWMDESTGYVVPKGPKRIYAGGQQPDQRVKVPSEVLEMPFVVQ